MQCPTCKNSVLQAVEIEDGLVAAQCQRCSGALLPLMNYKFWIAKNPQLESSQSVDCQHQAADVKQAKFCVKCSRMMSKFKISGEIDNRLDYCSACSEVWFDKGEWQLLKQQNVIAHLPEILTDKWQKQIRSDQQDETVRQRYVEILGQDDFNKINEFKQWLDAHPEKSSIKQFIA